MMIRRRWKKPITWLAAICLVGLLISGWLFGSAWWRYHHPREITTQTTPLAVWLRHSWVEEPKSQEEIAGLADHLKRYQITDAFFHVGPLAADGTIPPERYPQAATLAAELHSSYPELRIQAWIGQVEKRGSGPLDLDQANVIPQIVRTATIFLDLGFDGIHYNIEPIFSYDERILKLLQDTKQVTQERGAVLSIASDELEPLPLTEPIIRRFSKQTGFWTRKFYRQVAAETDQIAVMLYDTTLTEPWIYAWLVREQTKSLLRTVPPETVIFIGLPSYEEQRWSFHPRAENVASGINGVKQAISDLADDKHPHLGLALYANWTTDQTEWATFEESWLNNR